MEKKGLSVLVLLLPLLAVTAQQSVAQEEQKSLTILHTNDMHTRFSPSQATWMDMDPPPDIGGMVALQYYLERELQNSERALVLDAGDWMTGTPLSDIEMGGALGGGFIHLMNLIDYDATVIGNHELDGGIDNLERLIDLMKCDVLTANFYRDEQLVAPHPYKIYLRAGLRIAVIGLVMDDLFGVAPHSEGLEVKSCLETTRQLVAKLDPQSDLILLLTHQGWEADSLLATQLEQVDIIVGGHSHSRLAPPREVNGVLIAQAGGYITNLGRLNVIVQNDEVVSHKGKLISLWTEGIEPDMELSRLVEVFEMQIDAEYGAEIGKAEVRLGRSYHRESDLGNWLTDVMLASSQADFALLNSGGIRADLEAGPISRLDIAEMLPFRNHLVRFSCTGKELMQFLKSNAEAATFEEHGIMQVAGLRCEWQLKDGAVEVTGATAGNRAVEPTKIYHGVTVDYALTMWERYFGFEPKEQQNTHILIFDTVTQYLQDNPEVTLPRRGRLSMRD